MTTTPVFSEREDSNLKATRKTCGHCGGSGKVVAEIPTRFAVKNYACGYATYLVRCSECNGYGTLEPPTPSGKLAAAGENGGSL
jgi:hypothetical protein